MSFSVHVGSRAEKGLKGIPAADLRRIFVAIKAMSADPLSRDVIKLKGTETFRRRVGNIFSIDFNRRLVAILGVQRRTNTTY